MQIASKYKFIHTIYLQELQQRFIYYGLERTPNKYTYVVFSVTFLDNKI